MSEANDTRPTVAAFTGKRYKTRAGRAVMVTKVDIEDDGRLTYTIEEGTGWWCHVRGNGSAVCTTTDNDLVEELPDQPPAARIAEHGDFVELRDGTQLGPVRIDAKRSDWSIYIGDENNRITWRPSGRFTHGDVESPHDIVKVIPRPSLAAQPPDDEPTACGLHPSGYAIEKIIEHHSRNVAGAIVNLLHVHSGNWDDLQNIEEAARLLGRELKRIDVLQNGGE